MRISVMAGRARFTCAYGDPARCGELRLTFGNSDDLQVIARVICEKVVPQGRKAIMSDTITVPQQAQPRRSGPADQDVFMQVEKWLAVIRELARDQAKRVS